MLGQPVTMLIPQVVGCRLFGKLPQGATATDLVLTVTQMLRKKGVVGKFVEFFGEGLAELPLADRATIANMAPEDGRHVRHLPRRRGNAEVPAHDRPARSADSASRVVLQGTGDVPHQGNSGSDILRYAGARSGDDRTLHGRPLSPSGSRSLERREELVPRSVAEFASQKQVEADPCRGSDGRGLGRFSGPEFSRDRGCGRLASRRIAKTLPSFTTVRS